MKSKALVLLFILKTASSQVWGGYDSNKLQDANYLLSGPFLNTLSRLVQEHGGSVRVTSTITNEFLDTIDVFFTSRVNVFLQPDEESAMLDWVNNNGGVLIITGDHQPVVDIEVMESIAQLFGFAQFGFPFSFLSSTLPTDPGAHHLMNGVNSLSFPGGSGFHVPAGALVLATQNALPCISLLETASGGAVLVTGDWDMWSGNYIFLEDNLIFVENVIGWTIDILETSPSPGIQTDLFELPAKERIHSHFHIDALDTSGALAIQQWLNTGYQSTHLIQPDCTKQPFLTSEGDQRFVRFDGENDILINRYWQLDVSQFTVAIVFRQYEIVYNDNYPFHLGDHKNPEGNPQMLALEWTETAGVFDIAYGSSNDKRGTSNKVKEGTWMVMLIYANEARTDTQVRVNRQAVAMSQEPAGNFDTFTRMSLGGLDFAIQHDTKNGPVDIAEFIVYDRTLTAAENTLVEDYLFEKHTLDNV